MDFLGRDVISIKELSKDEITSILSFAKKMVPYAAGEQQTTILQDKVLSVLFFEPSTRTRLSFESAMNRLGGRVIGFADPSGTSQKKGESLADTIRMADSYSDAIVLRHPQEGAARLSAEFATHPVINAGDGAGQHPTQALQDIYTIQKEVGSLNDLSISRVGDLKNGRTVHALVELLSLFKARLFLVSPALLRIPEEISSRLKAKGLAIIETEDMAEAASHSDLVYMTRIQKERFANISDYEGVKGSYIINAKFLEGLKKKITILHPLPRVDEIHPEVDAYPGAAYFRQVRNGVYVRMALLAMVMGVK